MTTERHQNRLNTPDSEIPDSGVLTLRNADRYSLRPLPDAWLPLLNALLPDDAAHTAPGEAERVARPDIGKILDVLFTPLTERERQILWKRTGLKMTLEEVGQRHRLTRERVRQLQRRATSTVLSGPLEPLIALMDAASQQSMQVLDASGASSDFFPGANADDLTGTLLSLWKSASAAALDAHPLTGGGWLLVTPGSLDLPRLHDRLKEKVRFLSPAEITETGNDARALHIAPKLKSDVYLTRDGRAGLSSWNIQQWVMVIATELAENGHVTWHFSELAQALHHLMPERFPESNGPSILGIVKKNRQGVFENVGRKGEWGLRKYGDGHRNTFLAVVEVLTAAGKPLNIQEILGQLKRPVARQTVTALLYRNPDFTKHSYRHYGLASWPTPKNLPEETLLAELFARHGQKPLSAKTVETAAVVSGLDPKRVRLIAGTSQNYRYHSVKKLYAPAEPHLTLLWKFESWHHNRTLQCNSPAPEVLKAGLDDLRSRGREETLSNLRTYFQERGWTFPEAD